MKKKKSNRNAQISVNSSLKRDFPDDSVSEDDGEPIKEDDGHHESMLMTIPTVSKSKKKSGGFQSFGLSYPILKGILKKGYRVPTPIQRKAIPIILEGKDVVAMARTGSGKTGAFLIPMLEKLKTKNSTAGARALIFSPTRELAMQTLKFTKELGRHTGLKTTLVLGGQKIEDQFAAMHANPDIIIATPGRFLHLVVEMDLKLSSVEYIVFDEADRLFEMGFREQLEEVLNRLPLHRQTLMFSATLPCLLVDFVKAGLTDPVLIRLDVESKLSENLKTSYICCRPADKPAILLHLLKHVLNLTEELTVVFLATRHHVEYVKEVLERASIPCSYVYSSLDQMARKINVEKFKTRKVNVLLVTDIAARGIDIPLLDNVVNYNFPGKPKLFVHRVGRVARVERKGAAYSLVAPDEAPYLLDLHLFLGKPIVQATTAGNHDDTDGVCGVCPQTFIDDEMDLLRCYHDSSNDLQDVLRVSDNAYKQYTKSRPLPSTESIRRMKDVALFSREPHPLFCSKDNSETERNKFLSNMKKYRPNSTIFEIGATAKSPASVIMRQKKQFHDIVGKNRSRIRDEKKVVEEDEVTSTKQPLATETEIQCAFPAVTITDKSQKLGKSVRKKQTSFKDPEHYVTYTSSQHYTEKGLEVQGSFAQDASGAVLDMTADDSESLMKQKNTLQWDRKRKRFFKDDGSDMKKRKMKTESGVWIPKSYKSDLYKKWQEKSKVSAQHNDDDDNSDEEPQSNYKPNKNQFQKRKEKGRVPQSKRKARPPKREMKTKEEILKARKKTAQMKYKQTRKSDKRAKKKGGKR